MSFSTMRAIITPSWCSNGWRGRVAHKAAFHSELLPAPQSDRAAMGLDAQKRYAQQMLRHLCEVRRRDARFPARTNSSQLGALLRLGHRQLPRHFAQGRELGIPESYGAKHAAGVDIA